MKKQKESAKTQKSATRSASRKMPSDLPPMLATGGNTTPEGEGWSYEIKWDGFRTLIYVRNGEADIRSRNNKDFNEKFYPLHRAFSQWKVDAIVDGEVVVINKNGEPDFAGLQGWRSEADGHLVCYVFDLLWLEGKDLMNTPLKQRRKILEDILPSNPDIRFSQSFDEPPAALFEAISDLKLEGLIAKKNDSLYLPGKRSRDWQKIKAEHSAEAVIAGYTRNEGTTRPFSALLLGLYDSEGKLMPTDPVGTGFSAKNMKEIIRLLEPLETDDCPFPFVPDFNKPSRFRPDPPKAEVHWVKPQLVADISFRTVASDGSFRHPSFRGIREDIDPKAVTMAKRKKESAPAKKTGKLLPDKPRPERKSLVNPSEKTQVRKINSHELKLTNLKKILWPGEKVSKGDMINYYYQIAPYILPYIKNRPQTLHRFPNGIKGISFYQKDIKGKAPDWLKRYPYFSEADDREKEFLVCTNDASLIYMVNLGCIEINPWSSKINKPDNPDWCIIDLDPDKNTFNKVVEAALVTHEVLDEMGVENYCKTSGSTGLHIYIPLGGKYDYEDSKEFARSIVTEVHRRIPKFTSIERMKANRKGKIYLDFLQNRPQATVAAPYSLRPKPGAPVSMPLHWHEVKKGLKITDWNIHNAVARVRSEGDLFKPVIGKGVDIKKALERLNEIG